MTTLRVAIMTKIAKANRYRRRCADALTDALLSPVKRSIDLAMQEAPIPSSTDVDVQSAPSPPKNEMG